MTCRAWLVCGVLALAGCSRTPPEQRVWGCVVHANCTEGVTDPALKPFEAKLKHIFGYKRFQIVGSAWGGEPVRSPHWVQPTKEFFLKVSPADAPGRPNTYDIEVYQNTNVFLRTVATLPADKPLFIGGQNYAKGKLIVVLEVRKVK